MENLSGHGKFFEVPPEIRKWNWGAFWMTFIWGYFNDTFISLLIFVPVLNIFIPFYLGARGNELSWTNKRWENEGVFLKAQKKWARIGWVSFVIVGILGTLITINNKSVREQDEYIKSETFRMISESEEAIAFIGKDFEIIEYIRGSQLMFKETTYSIIVKSSLGKYWAAIRLDDNGQISEVLLSHYFLIEGFHEVIIRN